MELETLFGLDYRHKVEFGRGLIRSKGENELLITSGPGVAVIKNGWPIWIDGGVGPAVLSSDKIGTRDFGAPIQFTGHGGISYKFRWNLVLGYRFYHMSDAGFFNGKGLNRQLIELGYHF